MQKPWMRSLALFLGLSCTNSGIRDVVRDCDWYTLHQHGETSTAGRPEQEKRMSSPTLVDDDTAVTAMTGSERAAIIERLTQACATSVVAPVRSQRHRARHTGRSSGMWRCQ